jgi:prevent-host-death family protein
MTTTVNILNAKSNLSRLVAAVETGAEREIVIARNGKPVARIVPLPQSPAGRRIGLLAGQFTAPADFDADNETVAKLLGGGD